ncbi:TrlF family AAA-like ATPase [Erwinia billingiae]|uniref:TrlF family AAA-like ATPase n=1 Tax=Erwinia billingiae TaxID=182337 RepID=UPI00320B3C78
MLNRGSEWRRWEPHIHAPGTVLNDQFKGKDVWETYLKLLEEAQPAITAVGITDYYLTDIYEEVLKKKHSGRLSGIGLIFPNVELRLDVAARKGFVNIHLLISPEDPDHIAQTQRFLKQLTFHAYDETYSCTRDDFIGLGRKAGREDLDDRAALVVGATQFKVNFKQLRESFHASSWAKKNILVAVAGGSGDGTSGLQSAADTTSRQEIEKFAHIIFSSSPAQREFWLGNGAVSVDDLRSRYDGCKPCLHGSDSHSLDKVAIPDQNRYSWVKGGPDFDALRQACIDPGGRAYTGEEPPSSALPSQVIEHVTLHSAKWLTTPSIPLNPGLTAIIGSRGSGKTALADIIAAGCDSAFKQASDGNGSSATSFLNRANEHLKDESVEIKWANGECITRQLTGISPPGAIIYPRVRYLSQQFVEDLCSSKGSTDALLREIERVIFDAHSTESREGALNFSELSANTTDRFVHARHREQQGLTELSNRIATETEKEHQITALKAKLAASENLIKNYNLDLSRLIVKGNEIQVNQHSRISAARLEKKAGITALQKQVRIYRLMQDEVTSSREARFPELLRQMQEKYAESRLTQAAWNDFLLTYSGDVDQCLKSLVEVAEHSITLQTGQPLTVPSDSQTPLISDQADLTGVSLSLLEAELLRLEGIFSADKATREQYTSVNKRLQTENASLKVLQEKLQDANGAAERKRLLAAEREHSYGRLFEAIISEQQELAGLYAPVMARIDQAGGTLRKLSFHVRRRADCETWAEIAEESLLDRRKAGPFYGKGALVRLAVSALQNVWETGSADEIRTALSNFGREHYATFNQHALCSADDPEKFREWLRTFANWLFSTDHIKVSYEIRYDGVDITRLSPGTRGIVLLLLYLSLDEADDRPLIIDQPEENLDPKSVFDELVQLFVAAKLRRQVIIVTHNANLVINTDADQIIIASSGHGKPSSLPDITYISGGLDNPSIRQQVCEILEGGESAFTERARRLRVRLSR